MVEGNNVLHSCTKHVELLRGFEVYMKSKWCPEWGQYLTDFDDFGAVEKLTSVAFQRRQNRENPSSIDLVQSAILISYFSKTPQ